jgi:pSer/pThr/pTyr-binding forkhead associated (FHA) protein
VKLLVLEGPAARASFEIRGPMTLIGRAPDCDVLVFDAQVSRHHAQVVQHGAEFHVQTLQQSNPVIVNDRVVTGRQRLVDGDLIVLGGVVLEVDIPPVTRTDTRSLEQSTVPMVEERRTPRAPAMPLPPPLERLRGIAARLAAAAQRVQTRAAARPSTSLISAADMPALDAIVAEHERLGGDAELARLAGLLSERLGNQTDIRALYHLSAEAGALIAWSRIAQRSIEEATHLAEVLGAQ